MMSDTEIWYEINKLKRNRSKCSCVPTTVNELPTINQGDVILDDVIYYWNGTTYVAYGGGGGSIIKQSDTSRASTIIMADDPELTTELEANTTYIFALKLFITGAAAADIDITFTLPTGYSGFKADRQYSLQTTTLLNVIYKASLSGSTTVPQTISWIGVINTVDAGTFAVSWAQDVSNAIASTIWKGSSFLVEKQN